MGETVDCMTTSTPAVVCPSCAEVYDSREQVVDLLRNSGHCVNLTCLEDLTDAPYAALLARFADGRRSSDRRSN